MSPDSYSDLDYCVLILNIFTCKLCPLLEVQVVPYKNTTPNSNSICKLTDDDSVDFSVSTSLSGYTLLNASQTVASNSDDK
jgi:hypothetical protein